MANSQKKTVLFFWFFLNWYRICPFSFIINARTSLCALISLMSVYKNAIGKIPLLCQWYSCFSYLNIQRGLAGPVYTYLHIYMKAWQGRRLVLQRACSISCWLGCTKQMSLDAGLPQLYTFEFVCILIPGFGIKSTQVFVQKAPGELHLNVRWGQSNASVFLTGGSRFSAEGEAAQGGAAEELWGAKCSCSGGQEVGSPSGHDLLTHMWVL